MNTTAQDALAVLEPAKPEVQTRTGATFPVRPVSQADEPLLTAFFQRVRPDDRRFRFLGSDDRVGQEQVAPMVETDHFRAETFLAFDRSDELVATGMVACDGPLDTAEVAISVRSDYRGQGLGWAMLDFVAAEAGRRGVRRVISIESRDNHAAIEIEREKGFAAQGIEGDPGVVLLEKLLR